MLMILKQTTKKMSPNWSQHWLWLIFPASEFCIYSLDLIKLVSHYIFRIFDKGCYGQMRSYFDNDVVIQILIIKYYLLYGYMYVYYIFTGESQCGCKIYKLKSTIRYLVNLWVCLGLDIDKSINCKHFKHDTT